MNNRALWVDIIPMMKAGGFVPLSDHFIMPGTPLDDYRHFLRRLGDVRLSGT